MRLQRVHEAVYFHPWFITASGYASVKNLLDRAITNREKNSKEDWEELTGDMVRLRPELEIDENGYAHIHVFGVLGMHLSAIEKACGNTGYDQVTSEIAMATKRGVAGFFFNFDSPGGMVIGCEEAANAISKIQVPTVAYTETMMCSAAYYMAAGCTQIVASPSAMVGNIGTICPWVDESKLWETQGYEFQPLVNAGADLKSTMHGPSITEDQRDFLQSRVNQEGMKFRRHVSKYRNADDEVWRAGWYSGEEAQMLGLIDEIGDESDAIELMKIL